jgi:hypothetical protein
MGFFFGLKNAENAKKEELKQQDQKKALRHIEDMTNKGSSSNRANTKDLISDKPYRSFIESSLEESERLASNAEIDTIKKEIRGGVEKPKTQEEKDSLWDD